MKAIKDKILENVKKSSVEDHGFYMELMEQNLHNDEPKVGIFWYNPKRNELFGVIALPLDAEGVSSCSRGKTCSMLHKKKWAIEYRNIKYKEKKDNTFPYIGQYEDKPRGRVFFKDGKFDIVVGSWINDEENYRVIDLVEKEFDLTNEDTNVVEDSHWDIGCGWDRLC